MFLGEKRGELQALKLKEKKISISRGRIFEECVKLIPHQVMEYSFQAAKPLDFNVHYHDEKSTFPPLYKMSIAQWTGLIDVDREQYYSEEQKYFCLIWENRHNTSVRMNLEYRVKQQDSAKN